MIKVLVISSDSHVWNLGEVVQAITFAKSTSQDLELDLNDEGPDFETLDLLKYIGDWDSRTTVVTRNAVQTLVGDIRFIKYSPNGAYFLTSTKNALANVTNNKDIKQPIGMFIGRSNVHRLYLSSYVYKHKLANQTFHYNPKLEFHKNNLGLEELIDTYGVDALPNAVHLIENSPLVKDEKISYPILRAQHNNIYSEYYNFLVEIVCETYYTGRTFFPTEKTWRPMILETPFIVQGPQWFLHRLRDLGFQTFSRWWGEGYSEDPADYQPVEIVKVIDFLAKKDIAELNDMYKEMKPVLTHNRKRFMELTSKDFEIFKDDKY
jgi:hypothetical protein